MDPFDSKVSGYYLQSIWWEMSIYVSNWLFFYLAIKTQV